MHRRVQALTASFHCYACRRARGGLADAPTLRNHPARLLSSVHFWQHWSCGTRIRLDRALPPRLQAAISAVVASRGPSDAGVAQTTAEQGLTHLLDFHDFYSLRYLTSLTSACLLADPSSGSAGFCQVYQRRPYTCGSRCAQGSPFAWHVSLTRNSSEAAGERCLLRLISGVSHRGRNRRSRRPSRGCEPRTLTARVSPYNHM